MRNPLKFMKLFWPTETFLQITVTFLFSSSTISSVDARWGAFGAWSACSTRCGMGTQTRTRPCIAGNSCGAPCTGAATETRSCGMPIG